MQCDTEAAKRIVHHFAHAAEAMGHQGFHRRGPNQEYCGHSCFAWAGVGPASRRGREVSAVLGLPHFFQWSFSDLATLELGASRRLPVLRQGRQPPARQRVEPTSLRKLISSCLRASGTSSFGGRAAGGEAADQESRAQKDQGQGRHR